MNAGADTTGSAVPRWFVWVFLSLLVLPFYPYWIDFEQVRRGLLLVLAGASLVALPRLSRVRGEPFVWVFGGALVVSALVAWTGDAWFRAADTLPTFQPWDAVYRLSHWLALLVVLRLGAAAGSAGSIPIAFLLAATSLFGIAQRLWLHVLLRQIADAVQGSGTAGLLRFLGFDAAYGGPREPVSVFGNLNVASEWTAVAAITVAIAWNTFAAGSQRVLAVAALASAGCYLVVDGSRSGLVALPVALLVLAWLRRRQFGWLPTAVAAAGASLGLLLDAAVTLPQVDAAEQSAAFARGTKTLEVRLEVAKGTFQLVAATPVFGLGPGQFAVHFPRVRTQKEIDDSSNHRQFRTEVRTAHDDWLELLADGGAVTLLAFAAMLFVLQRQQRDRTAQLPLLVLLLLMLVRAPLGNAPAAAVALWSIGVPMAAAPAFSRRTRALAVLVGLALIALGVPVLVANQAGARFQRAVAHREQPPLDAVITAASWMPFEPRWQSLLCRERLAAGDLAGAASAGSRAIVLRPFEANHYLDVAEVFARGTRLPEARSFARQGLAFDPANPELRVLTSAVLAQQGDADGAIAAVVQDPHPVLRAQLANHFKNLAKTCSGQPDLAVRFRIEHHAIAGIDGLGNSSREALLATSGHVSELKDALKTAERKDTRFFVLAALHCLDLGQPRDAIGLGAEVTKYAPLEPWQRALFDPKQLDRLRAFEAWQPFFAR